MGSKYTSFHVFWDGLQEETVRDYYNKSAYNNRIYRWEVLLKVINPSKIERLGYSIDDSQSFDVIKTEHCYSIYDNNIGFDKVETIAINLSTMHTGVVLFGSVFDDDVFVYGICESGYIISKYVDGNLNAYGVEFQDINRKTFCDFIESLGSNSFRPSYFETPIDFQYYIESSLKITFKRHK